MDFHGFSWILMDVHGFWWILMDFGHMQVNTPTFDEHIWEQFDDCGWERNCNGKFICEGDKTKHWMRIYPDWLGQTRQHYIMIGLSKNQGTPDWYQNESHIAWGYFFCIYRQMLGHPTFKQTHGTGEIRLKQSTVWWIQAAKFWRLTGENCT